MIMSNKLRNPPRVARSPQRDPNSESPVPLAQGPVCTPPACVPWAGSTLQICALQSFCPRGTRLKCPHVTPRKGDGTAGQGRGRKAKVTRSAAPPIPALPARSTSWPKASVSARGLLRPPGAPCDGSLLSPAPEMDELRPGMCKPPARGPVPRGGAQAGTQDSRSWTLSIPHTRRRPWGGGNVGSMEGREDR